MVQAILFDLDGVLIDTVEMHYQAFDKAIRMFGFSIDWEHHQKKYDGLPTKKKLELLSFETQFPKRLHTLVADLKQQFTQQALTKIRPDQEFQSLLGTLKSKGYKLGLASNCIRSTVDEVTHRMGIADFFDVTLSTQDVIKPKPDPEIYRLCCERLKVLPEQCLIIEDSPPGIEAARNLTPNVMVVAGPEEVTLNKILGTIANLGKQKIPIQILIPMAGKGQRFAEVGYSKPKPLIDVFDKPMIEWVIDNIRPTERPATFVFLVNRDHANTYDLKKQLIKIHTNSKIIEVPDITEGAACTALLASDALDPNLPLLIANSDQWVNSSIDAFLNEAIERNSDGLILTFPANETKWSFAKIDTKGRVTEVAEKNPISQHATVGIYYFKRAKDFFSGAENMIRANKRVNGEFYVCPVYNELIAAGGTIHISEIPAEAMHGLGTPEDLSLFLSSPRS